MAEQKSSAKKKTLTAESLLGKGRKTRTVKITVDGESVELKFGAIPAHEMDALQQRHAPTKEQAKRNMAFNVNTLAPELVSLCAIEPEISKEQARDIWNSENWSAGELNYLFDTCSALCMDGFDIPFSDNA